MVEETIQKIVEAEAEAEKIVARANSKAKEILQNTELEIENILKTSAADIKNELKKAGDKAEDLADKIYEQILQKGKEDNRAAADKSKPKLDGAADLIVGRFMEKYGNS